MTLLLPLLLLLLPLLPHTSAPDDGFWLDLTGGGIKAEACLWGWLVEGEEWRGGVVMGVEGQGAVRRAAVWRVVVP